MIIIITISFRNSEAERWSRKPWVERSILSEGNVTLNFPADGNKSIKTDYSDYKIRMLTQTK